MDAGPIPRPAAWPGPEGGRWRPAVELVAVVGLLELQLWHYRTSGPAWLNVLSYGAIAAVLWMSHERRRRAGLVESVPEVGALRAWTEVGSACLVLSAVLMVAARLVGDANETFEFVFLDKPPWKLLNWAVGKFGAALLQQLALQMFLWPTCYELTRGRVAGAALAASIFGLIHLPSPTLVAITLLAGLVWVAFYQRTGRVAPLVVSHMILAILAHGGLPERLTYDMRVGSTATADMGRFAELNDPRIRLINRRLKEHRAELKRYASDSYYQARGGDLPGFIRGLTVDILGRTATDADVAFWSARKLANPRSDLPSIFLGSDEYAEIFNHRKSAAGIGPSRR